MDPPPTLPDGSSTRASSPGATGHEADVVETLLATCLEVEESQRESRLDELVTNHPEHAEALLTRLAALDAALGALGLSVERGEELTECAPEGDENLEAPRELR